MYRMTFLLGVTLLGCQPDAVNSDEQPTAATTDREESAKKAGPSQEKEDRPAGADGARGAIQG